MTGIRPYFTAGVALVGASVIAVTPIQPAAAAGTPTASPAVQLAVSPFELYPEVIERTAENVAALAETYFADPFPIISATIENQFADLADAVTALEDGDGSAAFGSLVDAIIEPLKIPGAFNAALDEKLNTEYNEWAMFMAFGSAIAGFGAAYLALQDVFLAAVTFDLIGVVNAVVNIPALIIDGVLNGVIRIGAGSFPGGLLSNGYTAGPIEALIGIDQIAGDKLRSSSPDSPAAVEEPSRDLSAADLESPALAVADTTIQAQQEIATAGVDTTDAADTTSGIDTPVIEALPQIDAELDTADDALTAVTDEPDEALAADDLDAEIADSDYAATDLSEEDNAEPAQVLAMIPGDGSTGAPLAADADSQEATSTDPASDVDEPVGSSDSVEDATD